MKNLLLVAILLFSILDVTISQTTEIINPYIRFVDELNNPIPNLPVDIGYSGAPRTRRYVTNEEGIIQVPLMIYSPATDNLFGCFIDIIYEDYERFFQIFKLTQDSLKKEYTKTYHLKKMDQAEFVKEQFNYLSGLISLSDLVIKDTLFLYQVIELPVPEEGLNSLKLVKLSDTIFRLDLYSRNLATNQLFKVEKLVKVNFNREKINMEIDGVQLQFYIKAFKSPTPFGYNYRYMLVRR